MQQVSHNARTVELVLARKLDLGGRVVGLKADGALCHIESRLTNRRSRTLDAARVLFVQVASREGDLLLTTLFSRDESNAPVRPTDITMAWNSEVFNARGTFQNIFAGVSA